MSIELISGLTMLGLMIGTVLTKYVSTILTVRNRKRLVDTEQELRNARGHLKGVQNEQAVAQKNEKSLTSKKERLEKRLPALKKELDSLSR